MSYLFSGYVSVIIGFGIVLPPFSAKPLPNAMLYPRWGSLATLPIVVQWLTWEEKWRVVYNGLSKDYLKL